MNKKISVVHAFSLMLAIVGSQAALAEDALVAPAQSEQDNSTGLAVRGFREMPAEAVDYLATTFEPSVFKVPKGGIDVDELITARCGDGTPKNAKDILRAKLIQLNPPGVVQDNDTVAEGVVLHFPFCAPIQTGTSVAYFNNSSGLEGVVKARYPVATLETQRKAVALTDGCSLKSFDKCSRTFNDGDAITLPFSSSWAIGKIRDNASPAMVLARVEALAPQYKEVLKRNTARSDDQIQYISLLGDADIASDKCSNSSSDTQNWPFDEALVAERLKASLSKAQRKNSKRPARQAHVAIVDLGLGEPLFQALLAKSLIWVNPDEKPNGMDDADRNGIVGDLYGIGYDALASRPTSEFFSYADDPEADHGSEVSSLALGGPGFVNNGEWRLPVPSAVVSELRISGRLQPGVVRPSPLFLPQALQWARDKNADIVNLSLKHPDPKNENYAALYDRILLVAAAGNDGEDLSTAVERSYPAYAGGMQKEPILTVGAHGQDGVKLKRSNFGQRVDLLAPGCAFSALSSKGELKRVAGTSFAAPIASFTASLLKRLGIDRPLEIRNRIISGTDYDPALEQQTWSSGRLNIPKAISIYDDVLEFRTSFPASNSNAENSTTTVFGKLITGPDRSSFSEELSRFCNNMTMRQRLNRTKITKLNIYKDVADNFRVRYMLDPISNPERQLRIENCALNPLELNITFREKIPGSVNFYENKTYSITDIVDLVPANAD